MAELTFYYGTMAAGKSTLALQTAHNLQLGGHQVLLLSRHDRGGPVISSRIGLVAPATVIDDDTDVTALTDAHLARTGRVDAIIADEAQFYEPRHVEQLAALVDDRDIEVFAYGLLTDFTTHLFPGTVRLLELADRCVALQVEARCWCGRRATHNARTVHGEIVRTGATVVIGAEDADEDAVSYEVLCRRHHRDGVTRAAARAHGIGQERLQV